MFRLNRKQPLLLLLAVSLWALSYVFSTAVNEQSLSEKSAEVSELIEQQAFILEQEVVDLLGRLNAGELNEWEAALSYLDSPDLALMVSDKAWSSQEAALDADLPHEPGITYLRYQEGAYVHVLKKSREHHIHALKHIVQAPPYENRYLRKGGVDGLKLPQGIELNMSLDGTVVKGPDGTPLCGIEWIQPNKERLYSSWAWILRAFAILLLFPIVWWVCRNISQAFGTVWGTVLALIAGATMAYLVPKFFEGSGALFDPTLYAASTVLASLGHLITVAFCSLFFVVFLRYNKLPRQSRPSLLTMFIGMALLINLGHVISEIMIGTVTDSTIDLNLYQIQHFGLYSLVVILASAVLLGSWAILAYSIFEFTWPHRFNTRVFTVFVGAAVVSVIVHHAIGVKDTVFMFWPFVAAGTLFVKGLDHLRSAKLIVIIAIMAVFNAHLLNKYAQVRESQEREVMAERLAVDEDPILENLFSAVNDSMRVDQHLVELLSSEDPCPIQQVERRFRDNYFSEGYWERYQMTVNVFDADNSFRCDLNPANAVSWDELYEQYNKGYPVPGAIDLRSTDSSITDVLYIAMIPIPRKGELGLSGYVFLRFQPRSAPEELGFPELLLAGEDAIDSRIRRYAFSEYRRGHQVRQFGDNAFPVRWVKYTPQGPEWYIEDGFRNLAYRNGDVLVVMGTPVPSMLDKATTFSYLFMFYIVIGVVMLVLWWLFVERGGFQWSLRAKVRSTLVLFVIIGSVFFGFGARKLLVDSFAQRVDSDLREKTHSVLVELQHKVGERDQFSDEMKPELDYLLRKFSKVFFSDITLYGLDGTLLATSRPQLFDARLLGKRMAPDAYRSLALEGSSEFIHNEHIGELTYRSAYVPFLNEQGKVLAYLGLPYFARQSELDSGLSALLVAIVNLFVLLFALSMVAALFISNWTTRPLAILERNLAKVDLASTNTPLRYSGRDEIGRLVEVYNNKVEELKESAERLASSERESAWREMARQVAHEIKNPLTPMKLSIQHFERTWNPESSDAEEKLNRFSEGMVGQIDTLSRIAEEFAHFAKMPPSKMEEVDVHLAAANAIELFKGTTDTEIVLNTDSDAVTTVIADSDHLLRVFNNLIKNALQAIPDERTGRIEFHISNAKGQVIMAVHDNGNGIPDEIRERIFMPNFTTRSTGMGLGLAMVKRMIEQAGGEVWFDSTTGQGTTFYVSLPQANK